MKKHLQTGCVGTLIVFSLLLMTSCATVTNLGLNPNTTTIAEGRAYYRIITDHNDNWARQIYTEAPTGRMNIVKPQGLIRQASNKASFYTNYKNLMIVVLNEGTLNEISILNQPQEETGWYRFLFVQSSKNPYSDSVIIRTIDEKVFFDFIIRETPDGSWEFGLWDQENSNQTVYLVDGKTKLKVWDRSKTKDGMYILTWDETKTFMQLCGSPTVHFDYGLVGNAGKKVLDSTLGKFVNYIEGDVWDSFRISQEQRLDMLYLSMVYLGANPHATELLFSPEDAKQFWK